MCSLNLYYNVLNMKYLYLLVLTVFIASCGNKVEENTKELEIEKVTTEVVSDIDNELKNLESDSFKESDIDVVKIDATYTNPAWEVDMIINYSLDENSKIKTIDVDATTYDLKEFNTSIQSLIGKTIEEAKSADIAGWSLTTEAFKKALK